MNNKGTKTLETDRLILRQFRHEDAENMFKNWASDSEVTKFLTWPPHPNVNATKAVLNSWIDRYSELSVYNWGLEWKETGEVMGSISVVKLDEAIEAADIGYCMGKAWWGRGIMPEALRAVIAYLFNEVGLNRIAACHDVNNPKSGRVMQKAGMKQEAVLRAAGINNLGVCDEVWYSILKEEHACI
ncbi:MAG: GNAT family N-acetyltransferase [Lachnospiraceae bacterium]|nr:GNAT family N-acetyltransferase [Lachnospiraceae bacterium]